MVGQLACLLCSVDMQSASLMVPVAQAGLIAAPLVFRREIMRGVRRLRGVELDVSEDDVDDHEEVEESGDTAPE